jgi:hypothetical protein
VPDSTRATLPIHLFPTLEIKISPGSAISSPGRKEFSSLTVGLEKEHEDVWKNLIPALERTFLELRPLLISTVLIIPYKRDRIF